MNENKNKHYDSQTLRINIGNFIREFRIKKDLTGLQLGNLLNVSQQQISRYEHGKMRINIETLDIILQDLVVPSS